MYIYIVVLCSKIHISSQVYICKLHIALLKIA